VSQGHVFVLYQLLFDVELSENVRFDLLRYRSRVSCSFVVNRELIWIVAIRFDEGKKPRLSNAQDLLDIASLNLFAQVAFDKLFDLAIGEPLVQLNHNLRPPFGLRLWVRRCSLLNSKSLINGSLLIRK
jgi:hypothetical protein